MNLPAHSFARGAISPGGTVRRRRRIGAIDCGKWCGVLWAVCPNCLGEPLFSEDDVDLVDDVLLCGHCRKGWRAAARVPCPDATVAFVDGGPGDSGRLCRSHAERAKRRMAGYQLLFDDGTVYGISAPPTPNLEPPRRNVVSFAGFRVRREAGLVEDGDDQDEPASNEPPPVLTSPACAYGYILDDAGDPLPVGEDFDSETWELEHLRDCIVAATRIGKEISISTSFTCNDFRTRESSGKPLLWETEVCGGKYDGLLRRHDSLDNARRGHQRVVETVGRAVEADRLRSHK